MKQLPPEYPSYIDEGRLMLGALFGLEKKPKRYNTTTQSRKGHINSFLHFIVKSDKYYLKLAKEHLDCSFIWLNNLDFFLNYFYKFNFTK